MTTVLSYGGGVNSTAILIGLVDRDEPPDLILFADTGGELPETYEYRDRFSDWLVARGFPAIVSVSQTGSKYKTLEDECNVKGFLPSVAYGGRSCSIRWKQEPMHSFIIRWQPAIECWAAGDKVTKFIGYDAGEKRRGESMVEDKQYRYRFPLKEWGWDRKACTAAILAAGLCLPPKSACWFCPAMKKREVIELAKKHPALFARALDIEENAEARKDLEGRTDGAKGLGVQWSWRSLVKADRDQQRLFIDPPPMPCSCWDGTE
jgi:hypothetical protein